LIEAPISLLGAHALGRVDLTSQFQGLAINTTWPVRAMFLYLVMDSEVSMGPKSSQWEAAEDFQWLHWEREALFFSAGLQSENMLAKRCWQMSKLYVDSKEEALELYSLFCLTHVGWIFCHLQPWVITDKYVKFICVLAGKQKSPLDNLRGEKKREIF
jgi:hypothetical protein